MSWVRDMVVDGRAESAAKPTNVKQASAGTSFKSKKRRKGKGRKISRELFALLGSNCAKAVSMAPGTKSRSFSSNSSYGGQRLKNDKKWFVHLLIIKIKIFLIIHHDMTQVMEKVWQLSSQRWCHVLSLDP